MLWEFLPKQIRHIHGCYYDSYRKGVWVLTGDSDKESGLWFTDDFFETLKCIKGNTQNARAVSIIPMRDGLIVPTDSPRQQNYIQFLDFKTNCFSFYSVKKLLWSFAALYL